MSIEPFFKYLTYSERDIDWQIICTDVGHTHIEPGVSYPPNPKGHPPKYIKNWDKGRILNEYQLIYITKGGGSFCTKRGRFDIRAGMIFMLFPGEWHWYAPDETMGWDEHWVGFAGENPEHLFHKGFFSPKDPLFEIGLQDSVLFRYNACIDIARREPPGFQWKLGSHIMLLMAEMLSYSRQNGQNSMNEEIIQKARFTFEESIYENIDMKTLSNNLGVGYSNFRQIFKDYSGMSPYQYFLHLKINKAKTLLQRGDLSIKEIAHKLSFENQYYFSRLFKKKTGAPPTEWIKAGFHEDGGCPG
jgi:AraC-like DNA-binding protein